MYIATDEAASCEATSYIPQGSRLQAESFMEWCAYLSLSLQPRNDYQDSHMQAVYLAGSFKGLREYKPNIYNPI